MLHKTYLLAKIGADTAENERSFAEILPKIAHYPTGPLPAEAFASGAVTLSSDGGAGVPLWRKASRTLGLAKLAKLN